MPALLLWMMSLAFARSVAVLPLEPGAKTEAYDGLGLAMAGMLVTDLSRVPDLQLIERAQIDKVISEIELGKQGYVDPKTAVQVGKLIGAEWMVVGTWSVIEPQFLLSIRAVDVKSGRVVGSASTQGTVQDFVSVEKDAVEQLLEAVKVTVSGGTRRQILGSTPTESFQAMSTYAEGLAAEQSQDYEKAKARFEAAAKADPSFDLPGKRLSALQSKLNLLEEKRRTNRADEREQRVLDALAKTPDELSLKKKSDLDELALLRVRWTLLNKLGRKCQLAEEMKHFLTRHGGEVPVDDQGYSRVHVAAYYLGFYDEEPRRSPQGYLYGPPGWPTDVIRDYHVSAHPYVSVIDIMDGVDKAPRFRGLANFVVACAGPDASARVGAITELRTLIRSLGMEDLQSGGKGATIGHELEILELDARVRVEGMSERVARRLDALTAVNIDHDTDYAIRADVRMITENARLVEEMKRLLGDLSIREAGSIVRAFNDKRPPVVYDSPACQPLKDDTTKMEYYDAAFEDGSITVAEYSKVAQVVVRAQQLRLLGCVQGVDGMLDNTPRALAWLDTFPGRFVTPGDAACMKAHTELLENNARHRTPNPRNPDGNAYHIVRDGLWKMVKSGCASIGH